MADRRVRDMLAAPSAATTIGMPEQVAGEAPDAAVKVNCATLQ